jgi:hypothetical protein
LPGSQGPLDVEIRRLDTRETVFRRTVNAGAGDSIKVDIGALPPGAYRAKARVGGGPATQRDFPCERGGDEWADSRPDVPRLKAIADATGGTFVMASSAGSLPVPPSMEVSAERRVAPIVPPWVWTVLAAVALGAHWISRRRLGLA